MSEVSPIAVASEAQPLSNPHEEIKRALIEYCQFPHNQGFAIMLNGAWGSGKTRFIKDCTQNLAPAKSGEVPLKPLYVSLYGVRETSEIDELLFQKMHPILSHKATRLGGAVLRGIGKFAFKVDVGHLGQLIGTVPEVNLTSMLAGADGRIVIFDDFERALMAPAAILGYLNPLVEHEDCKVIIIADESQLDSSTKDDYYKRKEKTVGQTLQFEPDTQSVYNSFLKEIDDETARAFLERSGTALLQVFADSKLNNLRLLKQMLWDFERIWKVLTPDQQTHANATEELLTLLGATALELRSGRLKEDSFQFADPFKIRPLRTTNPATPVDPMDDIGKRYPTVSFDSALLDPGTICDCVLRSRVSKDRVQEQLKRHRHFLSHREDIPSWQALWRAHEAQPSIQDELVRSFEVDFEARRFDGQGIIYHIIGLCLWLAHLGYPNWPESEVEKIVKRYIDDIYSRRDATLDEASTREMVDSSLGTEGLGFRQSEDPRFQVLVGYEREQRMAWRMRAYPRIAAYLQELAMSDSQKFLREVCATTSGPSTFASIGVLKLIPAEVFAAAIASAPYKNQRDITIALSIRYERVLALPELRDELPWLRELRSHLVDEAKKLPRIAAEALVHLTDALQQGVA